MKLANIPIAPTRTSPTAAIRRVIPQYDCDFKKCQTNLSLGIFFDGTNNNMDEDFKTLAHSNIARLYNSYNIQGEVGAYKVYVPGVGTKFPEIGEDSESLLGSGCAFGCEGRVIYGLLSVFNALHRRCHDQNLFDRKVILALCRNSRNVTDSNDLNALLQLGTTSGLLQVKLGNNTNRNEFLTRQASFLESKLKNGKPHVVECFIDVFGFSRGAAEARVFCSWLDELLVGGRLAGVPIRIRFLGIFDTVASAGFWSGGSALLRNSTGGHGAWASADSLRISASVSNCVHMIAMHELRRNFPLDEIGVGEKLPPGWVQHVYPGAHSDVGGGYRPGELGISVGNDSLKLSQIPLNHMLDCALAAGVPLRRPRLEPGYYDPFAIHDDLAKAYDAFISDSKLAPRPVYEWLQPYLNWRWQVADRFQATNQVKRASQAEREILIKFNNSLMSDAAAMLRSSGMGFFRRGFAVATDYLNTGARTDLAVTSLLEPEARDVLALAQRAKPTPPSFVTLFDNYVHDSLAGFDKAGLELTGYWRYRRVFLGSDEHVLAVNQDQETTHTLA